MVAIERYFPEWRSLTIHESEQGGPRRPDSVIDKS